MNYLLYDCEIIKMIPSRYSDANDGYLYCDGWDDHSGMGVSVVAAYSSECNHTGFVLGTELDTLKQMIAEHDLIVGFNSRGFDDKLLAANGVTITTDYDLLEEVRVAAGFGPHYSSVPKGYSYKLDAIARANGMAKTGSGELAPRLWQQGKHQEVIDYCMNDVNVTQALLMLGLAGQLVDPNTDQLLQLRPLERRLNIGL